MSRQRHEFEYAELQRLSFTQLFRLMVAMVHCHSAVREEALVVSRARDCYRERLSQPAYAALFLNDRYLLYTERPTDPGITNRLQRLRR